MKRIIAIVIPLFVFGITACKKPKGHKKVKQDIQFLRIVESDYFLLSDSTNDYIDSNLVFGDIIVLNSKEEFDSLYTPDSVNTEWFDLQAQTLDFTNNFMVHVGEKVLGNDFPNAADIKLYEHKTEHKITLQYKLEGYGDSYVQKSALFFFMIPRSFADKEIVIDKL